MLVSLKHHFAFLCNRKCASISIETMLHEHGDIWIVRPPNLRHLNFRVYEAHVLPLIRACIGKAELESVCVVREPLSWLYSLYRFRSRLALRNPSNPDYVNSTAHVTFAEFVEGSMQPEPPGYARIGSQFDFVCAQQNGIGVDRIFLHEHLEELVAYMSTKVGRSLHLGYKNISPKSNRKMYAATWLDRAVSTLAGRLDLKRIAEMPAPPPALPADLLSRMREFYRADFALYERVLRGRDSATPGVTSGSTSESQLITGA